MNPDLYRPQRKVFVVRFEDHPGLEVVMRQLSVGKLMDLAALADEFTAGTASQAQTTEMFSMFADRLESWNMAGDDDRPLPATLEGVRSLDAGMFLQLFRGWFEGMTQAPPPLPQPSAPTSLPDLEGSLPMEPLSIVRAS